MSADELQELWEKVIGPAPSERQFALWLSMHRADVVRFGIIEAGKKSLASQEPMSLDRCVRYASSVMNHRSGFKERAPANG